MQQKFEQLLNYNHETHVLSHLKLSIIRFKCITQHVFLCKYLLSYQFFINSNYKIWYKYLQPLPKQRACLWSKIVSPSKMGYRYLNVCINGANYASISCGNCVKFGPGTPELTELICERQVRHWRGVFIRISLDILYRFSQSFHRMKALYVQMVDLYIIFQFVKGRCHGNQINLP